MSARRSTLLFFLVALVLCSWHLDAGHNDSTMSRAALTAAIVEHGSLCIDPYQEILGDKSIVDGHYYSDKAPLPSLIMVPIWWLAHQLGLAEPGEHGLLTDGLLLAGGFLFGSVPFALLLTLLWLRSRKAATGPSAQRVLPLALGLLGSFLFVYSGSFYNHLPAALFILLAAWAITDDHPVVAGLWAGAALACDTALMIIVLIWGMQWIFLRAPKQILHFALGLSPAVVLMMIYNTAVTGSPFTFAAAYSANYPIMASSLGFGRFSFSSLLDLSFSPYRGLFIYMPALLLFWWAITRTRLKELLAGPFILPAVALVVVFCLHFAPAGGWAYGPRYLTTSALLLFAWTHHMLGASRSYRNALMVLGAIGLLLSFAAMSSVGYSLPTEVRSPLAEIVLPRFFAGDWSVSGWPAMIGLSPPVANLLFAALLIMGLAALVRIDHARTSTTA